VIRIVSAAAAEEKRSTEERIVATDKYERERMAALQHGVRPGPASGSPGKSARRTANAGDGVAGAAVASRCAPEMSTIPGGIVYSRAPRQAVNGALLVLLIASVGYTYWDIGRGLVAQWAADENYSHGFLILPLAGYFAWKRRAELAATPRRPSFVGLLVVVGSLLLLAAAVAAAELFVARLSLLGLLTGAILYLFGARHVKLLAFPLAFLVLMIPPPAIVFNQIALPLQLVASRLGEAAIRASGTPVLRDGNVLELVTVRLEVAEACSGIRSIFSLLTFALVIAQLGRYSAMRAWILAAATIPIAVVANATRVAAIGIAAGRLGPAVVDGPLHSASGVMVFVIAVGALLLLERGLTRTRTPHASQCPS
jgi:exosortase